MSKNILKLAIIFSPFMYVSCITIPQEVTLDKAIYITESRVQEIVDDVHERLKAADLAAPKVDQPEGVRKAECNKAFNQWLDKQFAIGLIPKRLITPMEYGEGIRNLLIHECKNVNLDVEFSEAVRQTIDAEEKSLENSVPFRLQTLREKINSKKCSRNFINPERQKFHIKAIKFSIKNNTLNIPSPRYDIYYTSGKVTPEELKEENALKELLKASRFKLFAKSEPIPPRYLGERLVFSSGPNNSYKELEEKIGLPDADIIAVPEVIGRDPEVVVQGGKPYYIVPKGHLLFYISVDLAIKAELSDALCALQEYKEEMKAEEKERRKNNP